MITKRHKDAILFRLPEWHVGEVEFGIAYANKSDPRKRFIAEQESWVGVGLELADGREVKDPMEPISIRLHAMLAESWPHPADLTQREYSWPLWRYIRIPEDGDLDHWSDEVLALLEEMAQNLAPTLAMAVAVLNKGI